MLGKLLIHILILGAVAGIAMVIPVGFLCLPWLDSDTSAFVRIYGSALLPFGTALWSCAIWKQNARPWLVFFLTLGLVVLMLHCHVYDLEVR